MALASLLAAGGGGGAIREWADACESTRRTRRAILSCTQEVGVEMNEQSYLLLFER
jgi:hypothetical protein